MRKLKKIFACITMLTVAAVSMAVTGCDDKKESSEAAADVLTEPATEAPTEPVKDLPDIDSFSAEPMGLLGRAKSIMNINDDVVGYIRIPETYVDYPVFQYKGDDPDTEGNAYYMDKDMYGNYLESGSIFMDYRDIFVPDRKKQSNNIVLYGHNMLNGTKFASLHDYRKNSSLYAESPIIEFSSNYQDTKYVIIAYFVTSGSYGESSYGEEFKYWDMENMDEEEFNDYMRIVNDRSYISPDIDVKYGDQLITLQTCFMDEDNSRFIIIGRRLREGETVEEMMKKAAAESEDEDDE